MEILLPSTLEVSDKDSLTIFFFGIFLEKRHILCIIEAKFQSLSILRTDFAADYRVRISRCLCNIRLTLLYSDTENCCGLPQKNLAF